MTQFSGLPLSGTMQGVIQDIASYLTDCLQDDRNVRGLYILVDHSLFVEPNPIGVDAGRFHELASEVARQRKMGLQTLPEALAQIHSRMRAPTDYLAIQLEVARKSSEQTPVTSIGGRALQPTVGGSDAFQREYPPIPSPNDGVPSLFSFVAFDSILESQMCDPPFDAAKVYSKGDFEIAEYQLFKALDMLQGPDTAIERQLFGRESRLRYQIGSGCGYLCAQMGVPYGTAAKPLIGGFASQLLLHQVSSDHSLTLLSRGKRAGHISLGITVFTETKLPTRYAIRAGVGVRHFLESVNAYLDSPIDGRERLREALARVPRQLKGLDVQVDLGSEAGGQHRAHDSNGSVDMILKHFDGLRNWAIRSPAFDTREPINDVAGRIVNRLQESDSWRGGYYLGKQLFDGAATSSYFERVLTSFLECAVQFCGRYEEGDPSVFGLVLGDPVQLNSWPGPHPTPMSGQSVRSAIAHLPEAWMGVDSIIANSFLSRGPETTAIVIPPAAFLDTFAGTQVPSFLISMSPFEQGAIDNPLSGLWTERLRRCANLTSLSPYTVAAVVGPGARVLVFVDGQLFAYRDERKWRIRQDPSKVLRATDVRQDSDFEVFAERVNILLPLAQHLSPTFNASMHGALILWAPTNVFDSDDAAVRFASLRSVEPIGLVDGDQAWLTGRDLLLPADLGGGINSSVAEVFCRAAQADGAICLYGAEMTVARFATQVLPGPASSRVAVGTLGTKRAAAKRFATSGLCSAQGEKGGQFVDARFAVSVSSDGPTKVWWRHCEPVRLFGGIEEYRGY